MNDKINAVRQQLERGGHDPDFTAAVEALLASWRMFAPEDSVKAWYVIDARRTNNRIRLIQALRALTGLDVGGALRLTDNMQKGPEEFVYTAQQFQHDGFIRALRAINVDVELIAAARE